MKPFIKPSHKGLLHQDLGVPKGTKIPEAKLESAKANGSPAVRKRANFALNFNEHGHHGTVSSIDMVHGDPTMARISVKHTKPGKKKHKGPAAPYDYEHSSTVVMPAKHAKKFSIGQRVGVGAIGLPDGEPADGPDTEPDDDDMDPNAAEDSYRSTMRGILSGPKKKGGK